MVSPMVFSSTRAREPCSSSFLILLLTSWSAPPTVELTAPPMTRPRARLFAKRLASTLSVTSLHVVFFNQAKIASLKAHVILVFEAGELCLCSREQTAKQVQLHLSMVTIAGDFGGHNVFYAGCAHHQFVGQNAIEIGLVLERYGNAIVTQDQPGRERCSERYVGHVINP